MSTIVRERAIKSQQMNLLEVRLLLESDLNREPTEYEVNEAFENQLIGNFISDEAVKDLMNGCIT